MEPKSQSGLSGIIKEQERVLLCIPPSGTQGQQLKNAVAGVGGIPVFAGESMRWYDLLRSGFDGRFRTVIGSPRVILGLCKLSRHMQTPLYVRNAILTRDCPAWMEAAIALSLDCKTWLFALEAASQETAGILWEKEEQLLRWSSVLDVRLIRGSYGLELEAVIFPGKRLPPFPNCARQRVAMWNPESDIPFSVVYDIKNWKNH